MRNTFVWISSVLTTTCLWSAPLLIADGRRDFGLFVQRQLNARAAELFGIERPLATSALGPYSGDDSVAAVAVAGSLRVSVVSTVTSPSADMIALWPNDSEPTHLFVCDEAAAGQFGKLTSTVGRTVGLGTNRQVQFGIRLNF